MEINKLNWDTTFFKYEIGEIIIPNASELPLNHNLNFDLIVIKQPKEFNVNIFGFEEQYKETKVYFLKNKLSEIATEFPEIKDTDDQEKETDFFKDLAYESGKYSRFLLDKKFGESQFRNLYDEWIINSNNKKFAIKTFYIEHDDQAIGFVTLQRKNNCGKIGLIAINPKYQGKGLGRKLLQYVENFCAVNKITSLEIPTQRENAPACNFYKSMGYEIKNQEIIKHFWKI